MKIDDLAHRLRERHERGVGRGGAAIVIGFRGTSTLVGHLNDWQFYKEIGAIEDLDDEPPNAQKVGSQWHGRYTDNPSKRAQLARATTGKSFREETISVLAGLANMGYISSIFATDTAYSLHNILKTKTPSLIREDPCCASIEALTELVRNPHREPTFFDAGELIMRQIEPRFVLEDRGATYRLAKIRELMELHHTIIVWGWSEVNNKDLFNNKTKDLFVLGKRTENHINTYGYSSIYEEGRQVRDREEPTENTTLIDMLGQRLLVRRASKGGESEVRSVEPATASSEGSSPDAARLAVSRRAQIPLRRPACLLRQELRDPLLRSVGQGGYRFVMVCVDGLNTGHGLTELLLEEFRRSGVVAPRELINIPLQLAVDMIDPGSDPLNKEPMLLRLALTGDGDLRDWSPLFGAVRRRLDTQDTGLIVMIAPYAWEVEAKKAFGNRAGCYVDRFFCQTILSVENLRGCFGDFLGALGGHQMIPDTDLRRGEELASSVLNAIDGRGDVAALDTLSFLSANWYRAELDRFALNIPEDVEQAVNEAFERASAAIVEPLRKWRLRVDDEPPFQSVVERRSSDRGDPPVGSAPPGSTDDVPEDIPISIRRRPPPGATV